jgi:hypothetical protein
MLISGGTPCFPALESLLVSVHGSWYLLPSLPADNLRHTTEEKESNNAYLRESNSCGSFRLHWFGVSQCRTEFPSQMC